MQNTFTTAEVIARRDEMIEAGLQGHRDFRVIDAGANGNRLGGQWASWLVEAMNRPSPVAAANQATELETLAANPFARTDANTLLDFARRLRAGYELSEKQAKLAEFIKVRINERAETNEPEYVMTARDHALVRGLSAKKHYGSMYYWSNRAATSNRLDRLFGYYSQHGKVSGDDFKYIREHFKGVVATWDAQEFSNGGLVKTHHGIGMVTSDYSFDQFGRIMADVLVNGAVVACQVDELRPAMRRSRKTKES